MSTIELTEAAGDSESESITTRHDRPHATWFGATVTSAEQITPTGRMLRLTAPDWAGSLPGQHVDVRLTAPDGYQATRSYSLADSHEIELAVDRLPNGEVSPYLVDVAEPGDQLEVHGPLGGWFVWTPDETRPVQLIAGGSGIVPLVSMLRAKRSAARGAEMRLLYSVRSTEDAMYRREIADPPAGVRVDWIYTRVSPLENRRRPGRLTDDELTERIIPVEDDPLIYLCGSNGFVEHISRTLIERGYPRAAMRIERYGGAA